jgi:hypothetical protein
LAYIIKRRNELGMETVITMEKDIMARIINCLLPLIGKKKLY